MDYGNAKMSHGDAMPKTSLHTNGGSNPCVPKLEEHSIKSGFFTKKVPKGKG